MAVQRQEIKERLDAGTHQKIVVDLDEIIEKWVSDQQCYRRQRTRQTVR